MTLNIDRRIQVNALCAPTAEEALAWALTVTQPQLSLAMVMAPFERPAGWPKNLRFLNLPEDEMAIAEGQCLCCALKSPLAAALRRLFMAVLTKKEPKLSVVYVVTRSKSPESLVQTLKHAPFLAQRYLFGEHLCTNATK